MSDYDDNMTVKVLDLSRLGPGVTIGYSRYSLDREGGVVVTRRAVLDEGGVGLKRVTVKENMPPDMDELDLLYSYLNRK